MSQAFFSSCKRKSSNAFQSCMAWSEALWASASSLQSCSLRSPKRLLQNYFTEEKEKKNQSCREQVKSLPNCLSCSFQIETSSYTRGNLKKCCISVTSSFLSLHWNSHLELHQNNYWYIVDQLFVRDGAISRLYLFTGRGRQKRTNFIKHKKVREATCFNSKKKKKACQQLKIIVLIWRDTIKSLSLMTQSKRKPHTARQLHAGTDWGQRPLSKVTQPPDVLAWSQTTILMGCCKCVFMWVHVWAGGCLKKRQKWVFSLGRYSNDHLKQRKKFPQRDTCMQKKVY